MFPVELPSASGMRPLHFTILTVGIAILALLYLTYIGARWSGYWQSDRIWLEAPFKQSIQIGDKMFVVPVEMLVGSVPAYSILPGPHREDTFSLKVSWPEMKPARRSTNQPSRPAADTNTILINVVASSEGETMRDRLAPVYRRLARGPELEGPAGLKILTLSSAVSLERDEIVFEETSRGSGFIARCRQSRETGSQCSREMRFGDNLTVTYSFHRKFLTNWGRLDRKVSQLLNSLRS